MLGHHQEARTGPKAATAAWLGPDEACRDLRPGQHPQWHQDPETQLPALRQVAEPAGWLIVGEYVDHGISGAKGRDKRPAFDRLLKDATRRSMPAG